MTSSWQIKDGHLVRLWSGQVEHTECNSLLEQLPSGTQSGYLPPMPDFPSHSPFGGPSWFWFLPDGYYRNPE